MQVCLVQTQDLVAFDDFAKTESLGTGWGPSAFRAALENGHDRFWMASDVDGLKGFLVTRVVAGEAELLNIVVAASARRLGVGRALMSIWLDQMEQERVSRLFLEVRVSNVAAIHLYEAFGFAEVGKRAGYYQPDLEDALVMARSL
jgi:ribosomal-protein-alanine acetyltransferase